MTESPHKKLLAAPKEKTQLQGDTTVTCALFFSSALYAPCFEWNKRWGRYVTVYCLYPLSGQKEQNTEQMRSGTYNTSCFLYSTYYYKGYIKHVVNVIITKWLDKKNILRFGLDAMCCKLLAVELVLMRTNGQNFLDLHSVACLGEHDHIWFYAGKWLCIL